MKHGGIITVDRDLEANGADHSALQLSQPGRGLALSSLRGRQPLHAPVEPQTMFVLHLPPRLRPVQFGCTSTSVHEDMSQMFLTCCSSNRKPWLRGRCLQFPLPVLEVEELSSCTIQLHRWQDPATFAVLSS
jgi:hypothetical protein